MYARFVRGPAGYGQTTLEEGGDGTVRDRATGMVWQRVDDGRPRGWKEALGVCAGLSLGGRTDWRLPTAKELHTLVDYSRAPAVSGTAALASGLQVSTVESYFWTSTTLLDGPLDIAPSRAAYFAFGRALGWMQLPAGSGSGPAAYPRDLGPQGDEVRIRNLVRCVRGPD